MIKKAGMVVFLLILTVLVSSCGVQRRPEPHRDEEHEMMRQMMCSPEMRTGITELAKTPDM